MSDHTVHEYIVREVWYPGAVKQELVGELVRCGECWYAVPYNRRWQKPKLPDKLWCDMHDASKDRDWYCADGERKEG